MKPWLAGRAARLGFTRGKLVLTAGLGGMGGAQPLAITMNGGVGMVVEVDPERARRRQEIGYVDVVVDTLEEAMTLVEEAREQEIPRSIGLIGNAAEIYPELVMRGIMPDVVTDQTPAHDVMMYVPAGLSVADAGRLRQETRKNTNAARCSRWRPRAGHACLAKTRRRSLRLWQQPAPACLRQRCEGCLRISRLCAGLYPPAVLRRQRALPLGGAFGRPGRYLPEPTGPCMELFPEDEHLHRWLKMAREKVPFQGLPARICWLGYGERARAGLKFNEMVASGELKRPIVIGRDHLDCGSVASPNRETEGMRDGSDAISDWPILNALINAVGGATWVSFHHGGGVGIGFSQHAGQVIVADGTPAAARRLQRVLLQTRGWALCGMWMPDIPKQRLLPGNPG